MNFQPVNAATLTKDQKVLEYVKCKNNFLYFLHNYVYIPESGGSILYTPQLLHPNFKKTIQCSLKFGKAILMASRQLGKSTISAVLIEWMLNFFPRNRAVIINMSKTAGQENIDKIRFIHDSLPDFLKSPHKNRAVERKTYLEYANDSKVVVFYPSSSTSPNTLGRSLTAPVLYIDECSFIRHVDEAYSSAQPILSKAREQAKKYGYPTLLLVTATPNGIQGDGHFFFKMWSNAVSTEELYDEDDKLIPECENVIADPTRNGFVAVKYHWSEDPTKDQNWYLKQCQDLNHDRRKINQELDLLFVGGTNCIFDDDFLSELSPNKAVNKIALPHQTKLKVFKSFDKSDFYLVGIDTARSLTGDFCVIEIYSYRNFEQVAEFAARLGSLTKFSEIVKDLIKILHTQIKERFIVGIENNSIGSAIIEALTENIDTEDTFDYTQYLYKSITLKKGQVVKEDYGINTNAKTKDQMVSMFYDYVTHDPNLLHSSELIAQLGTIVKKPNGTVAAQSNCHDDLFMASSFCAFIKKQKVLEIEPLIDPIVATTREKKVTELSSFLGLSSAPFREPAPINVKPYFSDVEGFEYNLMQANSVSANSDENFDDLDLPMWNP
jgi:Terminase large subunit, T4likevirus-type, N-terminal